MTDKAWFGGTGSFTDASDWSPHGVPVAGDSISLYTGALHVKDQNLLGIPVTMGSAQGATLALKNSILGNVQLTELPTQTGEVVANHTFDVSGFTVFAGTIMTKDGYLDEFGDSTTINLDHDSTLLNVGTIDLEPDTGATLDVNGGQGSSLFNDGLIEVGGGVDAHITIGSNVTGFGTIELGVGTPFLSGPGPGIAEFTGHVASGQTFEFAGATAGATAPDLLLQIDMAEAFKGTISNFGGTDTIEIKNTTVTSEHFKDGMLTLSDGCHSVAHLHFAGSYTTSNFVTQVVAGNTLITHS